MAPGAKIVVYFAPNTDQGFIDALSTAVHDAHQQAVGRLDQLGRPRGLLDGAGANADGADPHRGSRGRRDRHRGLGRQRLDRRSDRRQAARRLPGVRATRARLRRHDAGRIESGQIASETVWNELPNEAPAAAASASSSRCRPISPRPRCPTTSTRASPDAACPMSPVTRIPRPATRSSSTAASRPSVARARWRRCGPV